MTAFGLGSVLRTPPGDVASASCIDAVLRHGRPYVGMTLNPRQEARLPPVATTEVVAQPACNDAGQEDPDTTRRLSVLRGVPASVALADVPRSSQGELRLYTPNVPSSQPESDPPLRSFSAVAGHPLHRTFHAIADRPDLSGGRRCALRPLVGRIAFAADDALTLRGHRGTLLVEATSRILTRRIDGVPRVRVGQRIRVVAVRCPGRRALVVRTIRSVSGG